MPRRSNRRVKRSLEAITESPRELVMYYRTDGAGGTRLRPFLQVRGHSRMRLDRTKRGVRKCRAELDALRTILRRAQLF
jgi:hypothetical protein